MKPPLPLLFLRFPPRGFTLIELMIVMAVIAILVTMAFFGLSKAQASARDVSRQQIMSSIRSALQKYYGDNQQYYNATNDFCGMIFALQTASYLPSIPKDPGGTQPAICAAATDGNRYVNGAMFVYIATASSGLYNSYMLKMAKESGGYSHFYNPN